MTKEKNRGRDALVETYFCLPKSNVVFQLVSFSAGEFDWLLNRGLNLCLLVSVFGFELLLLI